MKKPETPTFPEAFGSATEAVSYISRWLGLALWPIQNYEMSQHACAVCFRHQALSLGVSAEYAIGAWWDSLNGDNSWSEAYARAFAAHAAEIREAGRAVGKALADGQTSPLGAYEGPPEFMDSFFEGIAEVLGTENVRKHELNERFGYWEISLPDQPLAKHTYGTIH